MRTDSFDIIEVGGFCPPTSLINSVNFVYYYTLFGLFVKANGIPGMIGADAPIYPVVLLVGDEIATPFCGRARNDRGAWWFVKANGIPGMIGADAPIYPRREILRCAQNDIG
jgi:hypothetical protein